MLVLTHTIPGEGGVCGCTFEGWLPDVVLALAVDEVDPAAEELPGAGLAAAAGGLAGALPDAAGAEAFDAAPASPPLFDFLLLVESVVAGGVVAAALPEVAGADEPDAVPASAWLFFDFLLLADLVVELLS